MFSNCQIFCHNQVDCDKGVFKHDYFFRIFMYSISLKRQGEEF